MRVLVAAIIAALASAAPAAVQSKPESLSIAAHDRTAGRETYDRKARGDMLAWQRTLHALGEDVRARAMLAHNSAGDDLERARARADAASRRLETASSGDWHRAEIAFGKAFHRLDLALRL